jgi:spore coat polysaccharide biosynthesis protein SpsF
MKTIGLVQARMGSSRLPGKVLADVAGVPMLHHVLSRAQRARRIDGVIVATSLATGDDRIEAFCESSGVAVFRGSEEDVLDRYLNAARQHGAEVVVRLTADCPLLDPEVIDLVIADYQQGGAEYVTNVIEPTYPDGLDTEVFSMKALERAWREARLRSEREHVTPYIRNHPELFAQRNVRGSEDLSGLRWTVDEPRDLLFVRHVYERMGRVHFGMHEILELIGKHPEIAQLNSAIRRNEGYEKSQREDVFVTPEGSA